MPTADAAPENNVAMTVETVLPLLALRVTAGPVELRGITDELLGPLVGLAAGGISAPGGPPFLVPWEYAKHVTSAAFGDNKASVAVSRKVGYTANGVDIWARDGQPVPHQRFLLSRGNLVRYEHPLAVTGLAAFRRSLGLDAPGGPADAGQRTPRGTPVGGGGSG